MVEGHAGQDHEDDVERGAVAGLAEDGHGHECHLTEDDGGGEQRDPATPQHHRPAQGGDGDDVVAEQPDRGRQPGAADASPFEVDLLPRHEDAEGAPQARRHHDRRPDPGGAPRSGWRPTEEPRRPLTQSVTRLGGPSTAHAEDQYPSRAPVIGLVAVGRGQRHAESVGAGTSNARTRQRVGPPRGEDAQRRDRATPRTAPAGCATTVPRSSSPAGTARNPTSSTSSERVSAHSAHSAPSKAARINEGRCQRR